MYECLDLCLSMFNAHSDGVGVLNIKGNGWFV